MRLTRSAGYALVAVGHIARNSNGEPVLAKEIAAQYKIPLDYLLKIMQQLVRAEVLNSVRGPRGGFTLSRVPNKINLLEIVEAVDGPFVTRPKVCDAKAEIAYNRALADRYEQAAEQAAKTLRKTSVASLGLEPDRGVQAGRARRKTARATATKKKVKKAVRTKKTARKTAGKTPGKAKKKTASKTAKKRGRPRKS